MTPHIDFGVRKDRLAQTRLRTRPLAPLAAGQVRLAVESFALTTNNITYAKFSDAMNYWQFFPTGEDGWGCIPVWGFQTTIFFALASKAKKAERARRCCCAAPPAKRRTARLFSWRSALACRWWR